MKNRLISLNDYRDTYIDQPLSSFALAYRPEGFVTDQILAPVTVNKIRDLYYIFGSENMKLYGTRRDVKGKSQSVDDTLSTTTYNCDPHSLNKLINRIDQEAIPLANLEQQAVMGLMDRMMIAYEKEVLDLFGTYTNYASSSYYTTLTGTDQWDDDGGVSDPKEQITDAIATVKAGCGRAPNSILIPWRVAIELAKHPRVEALVKYNAGMSLITGIDLPPVLWGLRVFISGSQYDATREGQTGMTLTDLFSDKVCVFYNNPMAGLYDMTFAKNFKYGQLGFYVKRIPMGAEYLFDLLKIELVDEGRDPKIVCNTAAYLYQDVLAAV